MPVKSCEHLNKETDNSLLEGPTPSKEYNSLKIEMQEIASKTKSLEITPNSGDKKELLTGAYNLLLNQYSNSNELDELVDIQTMVERKIIEVSRVYHVVCVVNVCNTVIATGICSYYNKTNTGIIEYMAVYKGMKQSIRYLLYTRLFENMCSIMNADAVNNNKTQLDYIISELCADESNDNELLNLYRTFNFKKLELSYTQPALSQNKTKVRGQSLIVNKYPNFSKDRAIAIPKAILLETMRLYLKHGFDIDEPEKNFSWQSLCVQSSSVRSIGSVKV